jgi:hypothetical protein
MKMYSIEIDEKVWGFLQKLRARRNPFRKF